MEKLKKVVTHWGFTAAVGLLVGAGVTFAVLLFASLRPLETAHEERGRQIEELSGNLAAREEELDAVNGELRDTKAVLDEKSSQLDAANADIEAKQAALSEMEQKAAAVQKELSDSKKELSDNQKALEKAKRGVDRLSNLDRLFTQFETQSLELNTLLDNYYIALENGETNMAIGYADQYNSLAAEVEKTYTQITRLLEEFRKGNY